LTLGFGAEHFYFQRGRIGGAKLSGEGGKAADYMFAATLCRAIVLFTAPLAQVMFPKLVHGRASSQKTNLLGVTLLGTGGLSALAVLGLTLVSPFIMQHFSKGDYAPIVKLIPWFAGAMVPLGMGNVLLNNLMAHSRFKIVPALVVLAAGIGRRSNISRLLQNGHSNLRRVHGGLFHHLRVFHLGRGKREGCGLGPVRH